MMTDHEDELNIMITMTSHYWATVCKTVRPMISDHVCWPDCKPEGPLFSAEFVCLSVCVCVCVRL